MKLGSNTISNLKLGSTQVKEVRLGTQLVWNSVSIDPDYQAVLDRATFLGYSLPSPSQQISQNNLVLQLKSIGVWNKLDVFYNFLTDAGQDFATLNWKSPTNHQATLYSSPTYLINGGFRTDGIASYIGTNFNSSIHSVNYTLNDASRHAYFVNCLSTSGGIDGTSANTLNTMRVNSTGLQRLNQINNSVPNYGFGNIGGMNSIHRLNTNDLTVFKNKTSSNLIGASSAFVNNEQVISRSRNDFSKADFMMYALGASLVSEQSDFVDAFNSYSATALDADYQAILDYAESQSIALPSDAQKVAQNALLSNMKATGVWGKLDVFYNFATDAGQEFATINWKNPSAHRATLVNSPTFTTNVGFQGNGTSSFINTNFNPVTSGVNYTLNNASRYARVFVAPTISTGTGVPIIDGLQTTSFHNLMRSAVNPASRINQGFNSQNAAIDHSGTGMMSLHRTGANNCVGIKDKTQLATTSASTAVLSENQIIMATGSTVFSNTGVSMYAMGASLVAENDAFVDAYNAYLGAL